jgi:hypothetical protein
MQLTLDDKTILDISPLIGETAVEMQVRRTDETGKFTGEQMLIRDVTTYHLRMLAATLEQFADVADAAAAAEAAVGQLEPS